jgi:hypothetical protein
MYRIGVLRMEPGVRAWLILPLIRYPVGREGRKTGEVM